MHFREDSRRPSAVPDSVVNQNFNNIKWDDYKPNRLDGDEAKRRKERKVATYGQK